MKQVADHPIEDVFGLEIYPGDMYWIFGDVVVNGCEPKTISYRKATSSVLSCAGIKSSQRQLTTLEKISNY